MSLIGGKGRLYNKGGGDISSGISSYTVSILVVFVRGGVERRSI